MLYIAVALYEEALPFLHALSMKKEVSFPHYELFSGGNALLLLTKTGALRAAAAVAGMLAVFPPQKTDLFLSVGTAACPDPEIPAGTPFILQQITDAASGRTFFPELLFRAPFARAALTTVSRVLAPDDLKNLPYRAPGAENWQWTERERAQWGCHRATGAENWPREALPAPMLYDMETSGVCTAALPFFSCEQLFFCRAVSDHGFDAQALPPEKLRALIIECAGRCAERLLPWLTELQALRTAPPGLSPEEEAFCAEASGALRLSAAGDQQLRRLLLYLHLSGAADLDKMRALLEKPLREPCRAKKEGMAYLELLREEFL